MKIGRQRLHDSDLRLFRTHYGSHHLGGPMICVEPRRQRGILKGLEVPLDALGCPCRKILLDAGRRPLRLYPKGVSAEVCAWRGFIEMCVIATIYGRSAPVY